MSQGDGESGSLDTPRLALYGRYAMGRSALDATLGYAHDFIDAKRLVATAETASSSHGGDEATAALAASRRYDVSGVTLIPSAGLDYVHLAEAGFAESGSPGFDLTVSHRNADSLRPFLAAGAAKSFTTAGGATVTPELDLAWSHELLDRSLRNNLSVGGGSFIVEGIEEPADQLSLGAGLSARMSDRLALAARYSAVLPTGNLFAQTVEAGLTYKF